MNNEFFELWFCIHYTHIAILLYERTHKTKRKQKQKPKPNIVQRIKILSSAHFMCVKLSSQCTNQRKKKKKKMTWCRNGKTNNSNDEKECFVVVI